MRDKLKWVGNIVIGILIFILVLSIISNIGNKDGYSKMSYMLGYAPMTVLTGSMEPYIKAGDMIVAKKTNGSSIKEGDVITYKINNNTLVTHRVIEIVNEDEKLLFKTKGDANNIEDGELILEDKVVGKLAFRIPKIGYLTNLLKSPIGFIVCFFVPVIILISSEVKSMAKE